METAVWIEVRVAAVAAEEIGCGGAEIGQKEAAAVGHRIPRPHLNVVYLEEAAARDMEVKKVFRSAYLP